MMPDLAIWSESPSFDDSILMTLRIFHLPTLKHVRVLIDKG